MCSSRVLEYYSAINRNEVLMHITTWWTWKTLRRVKVISAQARVPSDSELPRTHRSMGTESSLVVT